MKYILIILIILLTLTSTYIVRTNQLTQMVNFYNATIFIIDRAIRGLPPYIKLHKHETNN